MEPERHKGSFDCSRAPLKMTNRPHPLAYFRKANPDFYGELQLRLRENCRECIFFPE
jgi:hypothetical protein